VSDALILRHVTKRFGSFVAVDGLTLGVPPGQIVGFLGPNGAGKTTTLRMVMSILYPDSGEIRVLGRPRAIDVKDRIGYLPEERGLYRKMTVQQTLRYFGRLKGLDRSELDRRIAAGLRRLGLSEWAGQRVEALSKGMQQKVQFLATVLHDPDLVILDEPFSGLDPLNSEVLKELMFDLKARGATVIFSTHELESAERLSDRIVLIHRGRKLIEGTLAEVRGRFATRMVTLEGQGDLSLLGDLPGVVDRHLTAGMARLELAEGVDPHTVLRRALEIARVDRFEVHRPNLREIFVKLVGEDHDAAAAISARAAADRQGAAV
jgi:ABC-2 type transport system ATP-binding protein